jgi:hypothetical protein
MEERNADERNGEREALRAVYTLYSAEVPLGTPLAVGDEVELLVRAKVKAVEPKPYGRRFVLLSLEAQLIHDGSLNTSPEIEPQLRKLLSP